MRPCRRCGHPTRVDRMVQGYGRNCATLLGLIGGTVDTGHAGPDLFDLLDAEASGIDPFGVDPSAVDPYGSEPFGVEPFGDEPEDSCDGWDRPADAPSGGSPPR